MPKPTPIGDILSNERVKNMLQVTAPATSAQCVVTFKMVDDAGRAFFPSFRPVNVTAS